MEGVDWLLPDRSLGHTDHYDRYGNHYATTYYDDGVAYQTVYRGPGPWQIEVGHVSRVVTMRSLVEFWSGADGGLSRTMLVYPAEADVSEDKSRSSRRSARHCSASLRDRACPTAMLMAA